VTAATRFGVVIRPSTTPESLRDAIVRSDAAGVHDIWLWEDCFLYGGIATSSAALAWTTTARVGLGLMPVPFRNPALAAMEIASLARLFPGRFAPTVGHGVLDWMGQTGVRAASPVTLLREHATALRALLHGERLTTDGRYVHLDDVGLDWPPTEIPPVLLGARGDKTLALAGECADGMVLDDGHDHDRDLTGERLARCLDIALDARRRGALADEPFEVVAYVGIDPTVDAVARARELAAAGATTIVFQPDGDAPDPAPAIEAAGAARAAL
jgi:alkanesulfonate monooxygenase SsuD/methylene tetrahydromethanopterin reductase-like flavin-dependent oxidoreductase (luciferase family)